MKHQDLIDKLTLEQKCALLSGATAFGTRAMPSIGLPALQFSDGPNGMRHQSDGGNHLGIGESDPATCLPTSVTIADSWDPGLAEACGAALGEEAASMGVADVLGPGLCIKRSPLCGRNFEYFSEDPYLAGKMAAGYVRGIQSRGLAACPKHFAVNSQELRRQASDSVLDERTMREIYLTGFEIVVREAHPKSIMSSYNLVNGTYANENAHLLKDILRKEWGFDGAVVTDWGASNDHVAGVQAGSTLEMPAPGPGSARELVEAVRSGKLSVVDLDARVDEALDLVLSTRPALEDAPRDFDIEAHHTLARRAATEGAVLLKNEPDAEGHALLPLAPRTRVALVGDFAQTPRYQGAGSSQVNATRVENLLECARSCPDLDLVGLAKGFDRHGSPDVTLRDEAVKLARQADVVLFCMGLDEWSESEGIDRSDLCLSQNQVDVLHAVAEANPRVVVLLSAGSAVETPWLSDVRSLLYLGLGGQAGASAALDLVLGRAVPSGKLAETWPVSLKDTPTAGRFPSYGHSAEYREGIYVGYRYYQTAGVPVAFPFGFGLSYTTFAYGNLEVDEHEVSLDINNKGSVTASEVVQVYISLPRHRVFRPQQELKAFQKVELPPHATRHVTIPLDDKAFRFWDVATDSWEVEGGSYEIRVGASCEDIRLTAELQVKGTVDKSPYQGLTGLEPYETGQVQEVSDASFAALLGRPVPEQRIKLDQNLCFRDLTITRSPILMAVGAVMGARERAAMRAGKPDLNTEFVYNMPLRSMAKMTGGVFGMRFVNALVREARGWGLAGIAPAGLALALWGKVGRASEIWFAWVLAPLVLGFLRDGFANKGFVQRLKKQDAASGDVRD